MPAYYPNSSGRIDFRLRYNNDWAHKAPSENGDFKYGLCQCCSGPDGTGFLNCCYMLSFLCCPLTLCISNCALNGEIAEIVGTNFYDQKDHFFNNLIKINIFLR